MEINVNFEALAWCARSKQRCAQELRSRFHGMPSGCKVKPGQIQVEKNKYKNILYAIFCILGGDTWRIWLSMSFWNQFLGASEHIVLEFFKHLLCLSGAIHHWSVIAYPTNFVARAALGARYGQISWQAQHLEHVMIALMWPAQHFQQLRIILRGRRSTWSTLWFFCVASAAFSAAKDHFAWQAQHLKHVMIKKWHAAVGKPAIVTCFARLKKLK